ncbi:MAG: phosphomannomutase/phosphoglucomutase [Eubacteriales bacterium]
MSLLKLQNGSDIRGVALEGIPGENVNLTEEAVSRITCAFKRWLRNELNKDDITIAVGRDSRLSGEVLTQAAIRGLMDDNVIVYNCSMASTPAMFMTTMDEEIKADGAIMITASHLPFNRNGLKFFTKKGGAESKDIKAILEVAEETKINDIVSEGEAKSIDFISKYAQNLVDFIRMQTKEEHPFKNTKIIVDAGNGAGGFFADKVLKPLGADTEGSVYLEPNGNFPNHEPNPENKTAMESIAQAVKKNKADLGIIFDTDVDRAAVVDGMGKSINRNSLVALMSAIIFEDYPKSTIVTDSVTSSGLKKFIEEMGGKHHRFKRGYKNVINEAVRLNNEGIDCHLAMETSGHCALKENYFLDDGAYLVTKILVTFAKLRKNNKDIGDLIKDLEEPVESKEIRVKITVKDFKEYGLQVLDEFSKYIMDIKDWSLETPNYEGVRVNCVDEQGWCLVRLSLHDPVMAINIESNREEGCEEIKGKLMEFLCRYKGLEF